MAAGAGVAYRATQQRKATLAQQLLAPALGSLAGMAVVSIAWVLAGLELSGTLALSWIGAAAVIVGIQIQAGSDRAWQQLEGERERAEAEVVERTAMLDRAVRSLEEDVNARKEVERALRESEERHRTVSEIASDFSFSFRIGPDLRLQRSWVVGAFERITGYPPEVLDGHGWVTLLDSSAREGIREEYSSADATRALNQERPIVARNGEIRWLQIRLAALRSEEDGSIEVVGSASDVTERRRLEEHVQEVQRLESLGIMAGGIAHDFNNLLTVIRGNARLAWSDLPEDSPARMRLERIQVAASHAADLTEQMLTYAGKTSVAFEPVDISRMTEATGELLRASVDPRCQLEFGLEPDLPAVNGDPRRLRQVLLNLVQNASDALPETGGHVRIRTLRAQVGGNLLRRSFGSADPQPGRYVALEVTDDGVGMDDTTARRIFEPFFTTKFSGRGLGMAAVLGIARAHSGLIDIESEPGRGTCVRVFLPPAQGVPAALEVTRELPVLADDAPAGARVLVVDDDASVLELGREFLERAGFQVVTAGGGREALETLHRDENVDVVVLDLVMPDLDGDSTYRALREAHSDLRVVRMSGYHADQSSVDSQHGERDAFLRKPFEPEELVATIRGLLAR